MNETISKIVDLLFEDIEPTEEVVTLHDEVMNNCQERFSDLVESGLSADDATQAVVESLKGMEEMLAEYPRKGTQRDPETAEQTTFTFDPALSPIRTIHALHLGGCDLCIRPSQDALIHVICAGDEQPVRARLQDDVLLIEPEAARREFHYDNQYGRRHVKADFSFDLSDVSGFLGKLARKLAVSFGGNEIELFIPRNLLPHIKIDSASGDIRIEDVQADGVHIGTASGDIRLTDLGTQGRLQLTSASGDIRLVRISAETLSASTTSGDLSADDVALQADGRISTTSGDIRWLGQADKLEVNTLSGDLDSIEGAIGELRFKTASGDACVAADSCLRLLSGRSASGDLRVRLPGDVQAHVVCRTTSGDIHQHVPSDPAGNVLVELVSTSGDISVR